MAWTKAKTIVATSAALILVAGAAIVCIKKAEAARNARTELQGLFPEKQAWMAIVAPGAQLSPFTKVRYDGDTVMVTFSGTEYQLAAIDELSTADLLAFSRQHYGNSWRKRLAEDLVVVLADMGHPLGSAETVSLKLIDAETGKIETIPDAAMTLENRRAVHRTLTADSR